MNADRKKQILYLIVPLCFVLLEFALFYFCARYVHMPYGPFNLETAADKRLPFIPEFIYAYIGAYLFWIASFIIIAFRDSRAFYDLMACIFITFVVSFIFFVFMPTTIVRPEIHGGGITDRLVQLIYDADAPPLNLFPSMHCLASWLCFIYMRGTRNIKVKGKIICCVLALVVFASTQFVKQHYMADIVGGVLLAELGALIVRKMHTGKFFERVFLKINKKIFGNI